MKICNLCHQPRKLIESHIFPEFMYEPMYDDQHRFKLISLNGDGIIKQPLKGIYEKLLCRSCDNNIIGKYEDHAAKILNGDGKKEIEIEHTNYGLLIHGIDYTLFKLFQISLLWRTSLSNRSEIPKINLGPHAEKMRLMLLNENAGEIYNYGIIIGLFPQSSKYLTDLIISPELLKNKIEGNRIYRAIFNGLFWIFVISSHGNTFSNKRCFLSKEGKLPIVNSKHLGEQYIFKMAKKIIN